MKTKLLLVALLSTVIIYSQTQIGMNIAGEAADDYSGWSISSSYDGNVIAIGANRNDGNGVDSGQVRIYQNNSGVWTQIGDDINGEAANDQSGTSVSLSSDGSIVAIGARLNDDNGENSGQVRIYQNISGVWTQVGDDIDGEAPGDFSGESVSLSSDGSVVAIGAPFNDGTASDSGHVRVYQNISGVWTQIGTDIDGEAANDYSGVSVSLSSDGNIVAIGAFLNDGFNIDCGHVRVYQNSSGVWTQIGDDINGELPYDKSGESISLSADGNIIAIGASENDGNGNLSGQVRIFENISGVWTQIGSDIVGEAAYNYFGSSVSLSSNGSVVAIGAPYNTNVNGDYAGHVRIYQNISGVWTQIGTDIDGEAAGDSSGECVSLSSDGSIVAISAPNNDENGAESGQVRVFDLSALLNLEDNEIAKKFTLYPNPVNDQLQLQLAPNLDYIKATIYNYFGQLVIQSKTTTIKVGDLASGVYFIKVETNAGKGVKRFIKK